jgi:GTP cyclohydrolase II
VSTHQPEHKRAIEQAIDAFRRGHGVSITHEGTALSVLALDFASDLSLARFEAAMGQKARLLITPERAQTLKIISQREAAGQESVLIAREDWMDLGHLVATADPVDDLRLPLKGPFQAQELGVLDVCAHSALQLAKHARLLPAALLGVGVLPHAPQIEAAWLQDYMRNTASGLKIVTHARIPLQEAQASHIYAFRADDGALEHLAIVVGQPAKQAQPTLIRIHSECFTGDLLGSLKCDCGPQLHAALAALNAEGSGVLLYLAQEGRGIGLINKLRAYALQDQGFDTVDANTRLGFGVDERVFAPAAQMLRLLGITSVRLLTNNPNKVAGLQAEGIDVVAQVAHRFGANPHNQEYLATKKARTGHLL